MRVAIHADLAAVQGIVRAAYTRHAERIGREPGPMLDDYSTLIDEGRVHVIVRDAIVRGLLVLLPQTDTMLLDNIAVAPEVQGLGLGRMLMDFAERVAMADGYPTITLYTNEHMSENILFYKNVGYVETHRIEEKGFGRVYMRKRLSNV